MNSPLLVSIKERVRLNDPASEKKTYHLSLDTSGHDFHYEVGDCIGIYPTNDSGLVSKLLNALQMTGEEQIVTRSGTSVSLGSFLSTQANLERVNKKFLRLLGENESDEIELVDLLEKKMQKCSPQDLVSHLSPLMPRFYSIASSQKEVGKEIHLTVALTQYEKQGQMRYGCCSHFLCQTAPIGVPVVPIYLQKAKDFSLTEESFSHPIIMIGPGTGVAPFRGFMQERMRRGANKKNWLFFGERYSQFDFYYKDFWQKLVELGILRLDTAFSRDQIEKVYVQHLMLKHAKDFWQWMEEGAYIYVCGDASRMAKDVENTLLKIIEVEGQMPALAAREFLKTLRKEKRYLRDVY